MKFYIDGVLKLSSFLSLIFLYYIDEINAAKLCETGGNDHGQGQPQNLQSETVSNGE